jgi:2-haloacid dehalogenase
VLSNGSPEMLAAAVANAGLSGVLAPLLSVHEVATFKPDPRVYQMAVDRLGVAAERILFVSSNAWDAHAAAAFGMRAVWCNRQGAAPERLPGVPFRQLRSLEGLATLLPR